MHEVAKVLELQLQHHSFQRNPRVDLLQNGLVGSPCSPKDSLESSPTPQFKSINSLALSLLHSPPVTSIHDHRKNHSLDYMDLSWQSNVSAFEKVGRIIVRILGLKDTLDIVKSVTNLSQPKPKSLQMVIAAIKLKDIYSLEEKL